VLHLWGDSPYAQGVAYGSLLQHEITTIYSELDQWVNSELRKVKNLSPTIMKWLDDHGVPFLLNMTVALTKPYTPPRYIDMIQGIADATGLPAWRVWSVVLIPQAIQAACSMAGMWGSALPTDSAAALIQLRALDWDTSGPFQQFPLLTTYHIDSTYPGGGHTFSSLGWAGLIGTLTGMSSAGIGISEKVFAKYPITSDTWVGKPWHFMLEDVLLYATDSDDALSAIGSANRTAGIFIGVGQATGSETSFRALQTTDKWLKIWNDINFPAYPPAHPLLQNTVFISKSEQPDMNPCMGSIMSTYHGTYTPQIVAQYITALEQTGDMHIAIMSFNGHDSTRGPNEMWIANAGISPNASTPGTPAYTRDFTVINMDELWAWTPAQL
jgi:hypothetical protein